MFPIATPIPPCGATGDEYAGSGEVEVRGREHSRTVSDVSFISIGSGSQGIGTGIHVHPVYM